MADDQRLYSDEEFALILHKAAELASRAESHAGSSGGLTLSEMKSAASQAGLDPALVEQAARMLAATAPASWLARLTGGQLRHSHEAHFPVELDDNSAALLLSAIRVTASLAGRRDAGHSSSMGVTWHDGGEFESLGITARPAEDGTVVSITLDRLGTLGVVAMVCGIAMFLAFLFSVFALYPESPALGYAGLIAGIGGPLALARSYWASSTRRVRERISVVMESIGRTLSQPEPHVSELRRVGDGAAAPDSDAILVRDANLTEA
jgi:hypothetical protein